MLLDTSFLVAYYDKRDQNHPAAVRLVGELETGKFGRLIISEYVFDELMTILKKFVGKAKAAEKGRDILNSLDFLQADSKVFQLGWELFKKSEGLSFTDCYLVAAMKHYNIEYLATFDSGFHGIVKVLR
ncbi:MAG: PIN domain-containing protein [Candidatus Micrarchaeota archaeon]